MAGKRGISGVVAGIIIILVIIVLVIALSNIFGSVVKSSSKKITAQSVMTGIEVEGKSIAINYSASILQLSLIRKMNDISLQYIKIVVLGDKTYNYKILDYPLPLESETYSLNITGLGKINEFFVYPVLETGDFGIGERKIILGNEKTNFNEDLPIINPYIDKETSCNPEWECSEWSKCYAKYDLNNLIENEILLNGEQERICKDKNKCSYDMFERKECENGASVSVKKVNENGKEYVEVYDKNNILISRLEFIKGENNILNIEIPI